jgi:hypothetical protein
MGRNVKHPSRLIAVITADVVGSSSYSPTERRTLDRILREAFRETERRFPDSIHTRMAFRLTVGDEFQCVISDPARVLTILMYLRAVAATGGLKPPVRFRASVGVGTLSTPRRSNPYEEDGLAFVRARRGLERLSAGRGPTRWTVLTAGRDDFDRAADAVLCLSDYIMDGWTERQWAAVRWALLGLKRKDVARRLKIAHQNVTKRILAAGWLHVELATDLLAGLIDEESRTLSRVQKSVAPS